MEDKVYNKKNYPGAVGSSDVRTYIRVANDIIIEAWCDVPNGEWRGNDPTYLHGQRVTSKWLKERGYK